MLLNVYDIRLFNVLKFNITLFIKIMCPFKTSVTLTYLIFVSITFYEIIK